MNFSDEVRALFGQYKQNIRVIRNESTLELFKYIKNPNRQIRGANVGNMQIGKFYIIKYNFNGNKLWCPILTIPPVVNKNEMGILERQLKIVNVKSILYAVNFDYLPLRYKTILVETIVNNNIDRYEKNSDKIFESNGSVKDEFNFKVNWIYNFLKKNGNKNYAITAYDISKIDKVFEVSSTILHRFIFLDTYYVNNKLMYDTLNTIQNEKLRGEFANKIKIYEDILKIYETDVENFFTSLRSFEKNLKLFEKL